MKMFLNKQQIKYQPISGAGSLWSRSNSFSLSGSENLNNVLSADRKLKEAKVDLGPVQEIVESSHERARKCQLILNFRGVSL